MSGPPAVRGGRTSDYEFVLPAGRIAQSPAERRDESRLMVLDRATGTIEHRVFRDLPSYLRAGDALVLNTTRVFRARLLGQRDSGASAEVFLLRELDDDTWEAMVQPGNKLKVGRRVQVAPGFDAEMLEATARGTRLVRLRVAAATEGTASERAAIHAAIATHGHIPLPPYIDRADALSDAERYQTVFSREEGSVAAPTAGLHFTPELLARLEREGVRRAEVLLHVGAGTFKPIEVEDPAEHVMHEEWYDVPATTAALLDATRAGGGRICAVGTTSLRTLESAIGEDGRFRSGSAETRIFIRPPQRPRSADLLVTNFHLPRSTLLMLVAAVAGYELTMHAYDLAVREGYRFYSYGDAMLVR
ncbi:MAG: tRNA preQ1(34) S-adenosylmethionine ribosyltransferase-isomerase QueA [Gemmatimonadetes bacterium]|nr:tRNA preQ1(34) S-adenosylmethionine ribosyltransferase-isomerase QueA [Gemmatimonadota bacterium]